MYRRLNEGAPYNSGVLCGATGTALVWHSQFRSVAFNLYGAEDYHPLVRTKAIAHMRLHAPEYEPFLGEAADWSRYIAEMAKPGTWGDELTLVSWRHLSD